ncbi:MAG: lipocalin family protein [Rikenellaceae bacterium]
MLKTLFSTFFISIFCSCCAQSIDRTTVPHLDLERFLGSWHEVARIDSRFERNLVSVTAHYSLNDDGSIKVVNRGYNTHKEEWGENEGRAVVTDAPGQLRVSFFPMIFSDYNILSVGEDYQWALVGSKSPEFLWILSRTSEMNPDTLAHILSVAEGRGYDVSRLLFL